MSEWVSAGKVRMISKGTHDSSLSYRILDLVSNFDKTAFYIAKQDVPADIALTNDTYWECILNTDVSWVNSEIKRIYKTIETNISNPIQTDFVCGLVNGATGEITYHDNGKYCAVKEQIVTATKDMQITVDDGFVIRKFIYPNGIYVYDSSLTWGKSINIYAGQIYRYAIRRETIVESEIANIDEFTAAAHYNTEMYNVKESVNNGYSFIPKMYWINGVISPETGANIPTAYTYRASMSRILTYDHDVYLVPKDGYLIRVICYSNTGSYTKYSYTISDYDYTKKAILLPSNTSFKIIVKKENEDSTTVADLDEFSSAVMVFETKPQIALYEAQRFHKNPKDYYMLKQWIDAIMRPIEILGSGMPTSAVSYYSDGYQKGFFIPSTNYSDGFYRDADIYFNSSLASWLSMLKNPASKLFADTWTWDKTNSNYNAYFGAVCSSFVSYLLNQDIFYKSAEYYATGDSNNDSNWASEHVMSQTWLTNDLFEWKEVNSIDDLDIGDIYVTGYLDAQGHATHDHVALISDVGCDDNGEYVAIFEQTKPEAKTTYYTNNEFMSRLNTEQGKVCRFKSHHRIRDSRDIDLSYNTTCIPDRGDKSFYYVGDQIELYVPHSESITIKYKNVDSTESTWTTITPTSTESVSEGVVYTLPTMTAGNYYISVDEGNTYAQVSYVDVGTVSLTSSGSITCSGLNNCEPLWLQVMVLLRPTSGDPVDPETIRNYTYRYNGNDYLSTVYLGTKQLMNGDSVQINPPGGSLKNNGWYVRVMYKTPYGQAHQDSNLIIP